MNANRFAAAPSPLAGVPESAWVRFHTSQEVQAVDAVSESGGLGAYDIRPRRLVELGYATELRSKRADYKVVVVDEGGRLVREKAFDTEQEALDEKARIAEEKSPFVAEILPGRQIYTCEFVLPWTQERFLADLVAQFAAFRGSMVRYHRALLSGELVKPKDASMAGTLAVLHVGGRGALVAWPDLFDKTRARYEAAREAF